MYLSQQLWFAVTLGLQQFCALHAYVPTWCALPQHRRAFSTPGMDDSSDPKMLLCRDV